MEADVILYYLNCLRMVARPPNYSKIIAEKHQIMDFLSSYNSFMIFQSIIYYFLILCIFIWWYMFYQLEHSCNNLVQLLLLLLVWITSPGNIFWWTDPFIEPPMPTPTPFPWEVAKKVPLDFVLEFCFSNNIATALCKLSNWKNVYIFTTQSPILHDETLLISVVHICLNLVPPPVNIQNFTATPPIPHENSKSINFTICYPFL